MSGNRILHNGLTVSSAGFKLGSIHTVNSNIIHLYIKTTTNPIDLDIYKSPRPVLNYNNIYNLNDSDAVLVYSINLKVNTNLNRKIPINGNYYCFIIRNPSAITSKIFCDIFSSTLDPNQYKIRDEFVADYDLCNMVRPATKFEYDLMDSNLEGVESFNMVCKGTPIATEGILYGGPNSIGYIHTAYALLGIFAESSSANDINSNLGAISIRVDGIDTNYNRVSQTADLNGTSRIAVPTDMRAVNKVEITNTNVNGTLTNIGNISVYNLIALEAHPMGFISAGEGVSYNPIFTVPLGFVLHINKCSIMYHLEDEAELSIYKYVFTGGTVIKTVVAKFNIFSNNSNDIDVNITLNEKERITITSRTLVAPTGSNKIHCSLYGILKKTNHSNISSITYST